MARRRTLTLPETTANGVAFTVLGEGVPVITVHGGPGTDHQLFRPYLDPLADTNKLVYFDLPGHGDSCPPADYTLSSMSASINDILEAVGERRAYLLGSSYGSFLSMIFALSQPEKVAGLILVGAAASYQFRGDSLEVARRRATPEMLAALEALWSGAITSDEGFHTAWRQIFPLYFHTLSPAEIYQLADTLTYSIEMRKAILPTLRGYDIRAQLGQLDVPAHVVTGKHDWITPVRQGEELAVCLERSQLVVFGESGHYPFIEERSKFIDSVKQWLAKLAKEGEI